MCQFWRKTMCQFLSAIVSRNLEIYWSPFTDSHEDLIDLFQIKDRMINSNFVRVEYISQNNKYWDIDSYKLRLDEMEECKWYEENRELIKEKLNEILKKIILIGETREILIGGKFILKDCNIGKIKNCFVLSISGKSQVESISGSAQVEYISGSAQVEYISGSAQVESISGSAQIKSISGSAQIKSIYDSVQVESISDSAQVESIYGSAQVEYISGSAQVESISGSAIIINDQRIKQ
jgi:hypothetical protein